MVEGSSGLPAHLPLHQWSDEAIAKLEGLDDAALERLPSEPVESAAPGGDKLVSSMHGREPLAMSCGCSLCIDWRRDNGIAEPAEAVEAERMRRRCFELTNG